MRKITLDIYAESGLLQNTVLKYKLNTALKYIYKLDHSVKFDGIKFKTEQNGQLIDIYLQGRNLKTKNVNNYFKKLRGLK